MRCTLTEPARRFFEESCPLQPARQVNAVVRRQEKKMRREFVALIVGFCLLGCVGLFPPRKHFGERDLRMGPRGFLFSSSLYVDDGEKGNRSSGYYEAWHYEYVID